MKLRHITAAAALTAVATITVFGIADAHHNTVSCQSPGVWLIVNSEVDKTEHYTTDQGHEGDIGAGGSTTVNYSGTSLTVYGLWSNGVTNTATGSGDCTEVTTTTEATTSTTTTTVPSTTTTVPADTSTTTTSEPSSTSTSSTPSTSSPPTTPASTTTVPVSSSTPEPPPSSSPTSLCEPGQCLPATS